MDMDMDMETLVLAHKQEFPKRFIHNFTTHIESKNLKILV